MSTGSGIYILETGIDEKQYRVAHLQAVENYQWDHEKGCYTDDVDVWIENIRCMWGHCIAYSTLDIAIVLAKKMVADILNDPKCSILECEINVISALCDFDERF